jgi:peptide-methionine (S)-S-oxide reductase
MPPPIDQATPTDTAEAAFGLGCFWGPDALFGAMDGVVRTCVGYAGGTMPEPTYGDLGDHIETVWVEYDPATLAYADLLDAFWAAHDPTRAPFKHQYQTALFPHTDEQTELARASVAATAEQLEASLATDVIDDASFYRAEAYHQKHKLRRHPELFEALRSHYPSDETFADAPAAALLNGYVGGRRAPRHLADDLPRLGLSAKANDQLRNLVEQKHKSAL